MLILSAVAAQRPQPTFHPLCVAELGPPPVCMHGKRTIHNCSNALARDNTVGESTPGTVIDRNHRPSVSGAYTAVATQMYLIDRGLVRGLVEFFGTDSVNEFGAGRGCYTDALRTAGVAARGFEGGVGIQIKTEGTIAHADLTAALDLGRRDWVLCLEVAEHVPKQDEVRYSRPSQPQRASTYWLGAAPAAAEPDLRLWSAGDDACQLAQAQPQGHCDVVELDAIGQRPRQPAAGILRPPDDGAVELHRGPGGEQGAAQCRDHVAMVQVDGQPRKSRWRRQGLEAQPEPRQCVGHDDEEEEDEDAHGGSEKHDALVWNARASSSEAPAAGVTLMGTHRAASWGGRRMSLRVPRAAPRAQHGVVTASRCVCRNTMTSFLASFLFRFSRLDVRS